jgi:hypothetical protein
MKITSTPQDRPNRSRRAVMDIIASAAAASADPIFAVIDAKWTADVVHEAACDALGEAEGRFGSGSDATEIAWQRSEVACDAVNEIDWQLARTPPTTIAGVAALLRFVNEIEDDGLEWPDTDTIGPEGWHYQLRATLAAALEAMITQHQGANHVTGF